MLKQSYERCPDILCTRISENEIISVIKELKVRKAPRFDKIPSECFKYGGSELIKCLVILFNVMCKFEHIPNVFKKGVIIPIPKGEKDMTDTNNYRRITLLPTITKLFEKCIMNRIEKWSRDKEIIDYQQGAAQPKCSSMHTSWLVNEIISKCKQDGNTVFVAMLDTRKAYDTVWQNGLFYALYKTGICCKTWRICMKFYKKFECHVKIGKHMSESFEALQGIHQGAPCSMFMFQVFVNELLLMLKRSCYCIKLNGIRISSPAYADDLTIISLSSEGLQALLSIANRFSRKWRLSFNSDKCKILVFGEDDKTDFKISGNIIARSNCESLLGTPLVHDDNDEYSFFDKRITTCKKMLYAMQSIGSYFVPIPFLTMSKLYWSAIIPKLCYGLEFINVSDVTKSRLEKFHFDSAKHCQHLTQNTANYGALLTAGWKSLQSHCDYMKLIFIWQIMLLPVTNVYKRILISRIVHIVNNPNVLFHGPTAAFISLCKKYNVLMKVVNAVFTGEYMSLNEWKKTAKEIIMYRDRKKIRIQCKLYKVLEYINVN